MEQLPTAPVLNAPIPATPDKPALAADPRANCCGVPAAPRKLDLTGMAAPGDLKAARLEEFTIDGICGVY
jgi:hypothetical protein